MKIHKEGSTVTSFKAEELPEVFLKGTLQVAGLEEETELMEEQVSDIEPEIKSERKEENRKPKPILVRPLKKRKVVTEKEFETNPVSITKIPSKSTPVQSAKVALSGKGNHPVIKSETAVYVPLRPTVRPVQSVASTLQQRQPVMPKNPGISTNITTVTTTFKPHLVIKKEQTQVVKTKNSTGWFLPFFLLVSACVLGLVLLVIHTEIFVTSNRYQLEFSFDWTQLEEAFSVLKKL
jgi:hypothetical protein